MTKINTDDVSMEKKIRDAAEVLFLDKGFAETSTTEIAKAAGCNQALVHYYFRTKDRLFESLFEEKAKVFMASFLEISNEPIPFAEKLRRKIESHYDMLLVNPKLPYLVLTELLRDESRRNAIKETVTPLVMSVYKQFETELAEEIRKGTIRPMSAFDLIVTMISLNLYPFMSAPILKGWLGLDDDAVHALLVKRKAENVATILNSIRP